MAIADVDCGKRLTGYDPISWRETIADVRRRPSRPPERRGHDRAAGSTTAIARDTTANRATALKAIEEIRASGIVSARGIARELTTRKVPTTTGSAIWAAAQVQRLLKG